MLVMQTEERKNSYLVDHRLVPIGPGHEPYPPGGLWADPDVDHAAALMREVFDSREAALRRGALAAADIRGSHSPEVAGRAMAERLKLVLASPAWRARRGGTRTGPLYTDWVGELIRSGPLPHARRSRLGAARHAARQGLLRLLKPLAVHERMVDGELLKAIETVDANVRSLALANAAALQRVGELENELAQLRAEHPALPERAADAERS